MSDKTLFLVLHLTSQSGEFTEKDKLDWFDNLNKLTNGKMSVDGLIAQREAPRVHGLDADDEKAVLNEYQKAIKLLRSDLSDFENTIMKTDSKNTVRTSFNCPIELRDKLETVVNENIGKYTADEIMVMLLAKGLETQEFPK